MFDTIFVLLEKNCVSTIFWSGVFFFSFGAGNSQLGFKLRTERPLFHL